jgi:hypothetical protein
MKDQKFIIEVDGCKIAGTLEQCTSLLTLLGQMQSVGEEYHDGYVYYPKPTDIELKAIVGRNRWAENEEAARAHRKVSRPAPAESPVALAEAF